jgi:hypothetical protein
MKTIKITTLVCLFALLFVGYSFSKQPITDLNPVNIVTWGCGYDYRQSLPFLYPGYMLGDTMFTGGEGISGGYFFVAAVINPDPGLGSCLTDLSQIREVKAKWLGDPDYELSLVPTACHNQLPNTTSQAWATPLRPAAWMFTETWEFTLVYDCPIDDSKHKQTRIVQPNPIDTIPPKPTGILVEKSADGNYFYVSWIGMGNPSNHPLFDYRLSVIRDEDTCPIAVFGNRFGGIWSYADGPNRIKLTIPIMYAGKTIRIEQGNGYGMPPRPPGTLGGVGNRASVDIRLPD